MFWCFNLINFSMKLFNSPYILSYHTFNQNNIPSIHFPFYHVINDVSINSQFAVRFTTTTTTRVVVVVVHSCWVTFLLTSPEKCQTKRNWWIPLTSLFAHLESISPTFYERICTNILVPIKNLTFTANTKKLRAKLLYEKATCKMLVKLTPYIHLFIQSVSLI